MWDLLIINPMTNALLWLTGTLAGNFVLALAIFTILTRVAMWPLNLRQQKSMAKTQEMQPQIKAIQTKYKDNPQKMQEEFAKIGYNPTDTLTGCLPLLATMPILFGLYQVLRLVLGTTPQSLFELTQRVYPWVNLTELLPIDSTFLWMNLGQPDPYLVLPFLVFITMFFQSRVTSPKKKEDDKDKKQHKGKQQDDPTAAMTQSMQYTMPVMFGFFSLSFQAGLSIYFVISNIIGIIQGVYTRRVMDREKEKLANEKKMRDMGMAGAVPENTEVLIAESSTSKSENEAVPATNTNGSAPKSKKKQSKRKRRSNKK